MSQQTKTLLISGGSSGLGLEVVTYFLFKSWRVIVLTRKASDDLNGLKNKYNSNLIIINSHKNLINYINNGLDLLINNAGYALVGAFETYSNDQILNQLQVNFLSHVCLTQICLPYLRLVQGKIFNISSIFGTMVCPFNTMYCATKHAIEGFSEALHYELKNQNISCTVIVPGRYKTKFGSNMEISKPDLNTKINNIYSSQYLGFYKLKQELSNKPVNDSKIFALKIYKLFYKNKNFIRVSIDLDSKFPGVIKKYLPDKLFNFLQNLIFSKYFIKKLTYDL